jgi:hypothetical protein
MGRQTAGKLFAFVTFTAGAVAAYLMYRRGESPFKIAKDTVLNPIGSLASELKTTASSTNVPKALDS